MTDCLHYPEYTRDAIKLVVEESNHRGKWMVKMW